MSLTFPVFNTHDIEVSKRRINKINEKFYLRDRLIEGESRYAPRSKGFETGVSQNKLRCVSTRGVTIPVPEHSVPEERERILYYVF